MIKQPGWPQGLLLSLQGVLPTMGVMLLVPVLPLLMREFATVSAGEYLVPLLLTAPALGVALLSVPAGYLGDRLGHGRVLTAALLFYAIIGLMPLVLQGFPAIFISRLLLGVCEAAIITLSAALIGGIFEGKRRDSWLAATSTFASLSAIIFAGLAGLLGEMLGWRGPILVYAIAFLFPPCMLLLVRNVSTEQHREVVPDDGPPFPWIHLIKVVVATICGSVLFYTLTVQQGLALVALGIGRPGQIGLLAALTSLGVPLGTLIFVPLSRRPTNLVLAGVFLVMGLGLVGIALASSYLGFAGAAFCGLLAAGVLLPTLVTWTVRGYPTAYLGRGTGAFQSMFALGQFVSGLGIPVLAKVTGGTLAAFGMMGLFSFVFAAVAIWSAIRTARSR